LQKADSADFQIIFKPLMDLDFFNAQPQPEYQSGREPEAVQQDSQDHHDGDFNDFQQVDPQPSSTSYADLNANASNIPLTFDEPLTVNQGSAELDLLEAVRQQEQLLHEKLQEKAVRKI
jgi:hypothetical protein